MNPSNHTPGPWAFSLNHSGDYQLRGSNGHLVFQISTGTIPDNSDARLIASAPELLAALEIILSSTCGDVGDDGYEGCIRIEAKALERARAAISKAKGQP